VDSARLRQRARAQLGLFTREQARLCGASPSQIKRRLASGEWQPVLGKVLATADLRLTTRVMDRAAALAVPEGVLVGPSAARAWDIEVPDFRIWLAVGRDRHPSVPGIRYLRTDIDRRDITRWEGALVTTMRRAVVDCLVLLPEAEAQSLLDRALNRSWLTLDQLATSVQARLGRRGTRRLFRLLRIAGDGSRSAAERLMAHLLTSAGISCWAANVPMRDARGLIGVGDIVFEAARLVIELDGWAYHVTAGQFQRDRERQNRLVAAGWTVLRFTWHDLTKRPEYVIASIAALLGQQ
jgi:hypothetical protein